MIFEGRLLLKNVTLFYRVVSFIWGYNRFICAFPILFLIIHAHFSLDFVFAFLIPTSNTHLPFFLLFFLHCHFHSISSTAFWLFFLILLLFHCIFPLFPTSIPRTHLGGPNGGLGFSQFVTCHTYLPNLKVR